MKTDSKGSTGNQGLTANTWDIKHRKRAAYLWGRVDRPMNEKADHPIWSIYISAT